ncbi:MAG TPA: hypothetical protein VEP50_17785 [bacterium]|nr:hypothetical protein [bacterium]
MAAVRARVQTPHDVLVALATSHGPLVGARLDQGLTVYAINPKAVERHRDPSGSPVHHQLDICRCLPLSP